MKWFKYYKSISKINVGTEENPKWEDLLQEYGLQYSEANEEIVKREAYNGEYTIEDDGIPEPEAEPTTAEILDAMLGVM